MVVAVAEEHHVANANHITLWCFNHGGFLANGAQCENTNLRLVDDGRAHDIAEGANVRHGVRSARGVVWLQLSCARTVREVVDPGGQSDQTQLVGIVNDRNNQISGWQRRRHAQIDLLLDDDAVPIDTGVDAGEVANRFDNGLCNQRCEGQLRTVRLLESGLVALTPLYDFGHVGLHKTRDVRTGLL